ncbi:hypothetical protein N658DRAFT_559555 [Parathielavia hyrcaniae]|uniref:Uncharacterized protein n=1 Tax=Parathielavia hyrcaniae TaxID=113614 RepID=A0AAN6T1C9_9PEZI|nr:hypothetical protein N658DRAFT_559555 [Parathielavia hyrcaniae]
MKLPPRLCSQWQTAAARLAFITPGRMELALFYKCWDRYDGRRPSMGRFCRRRHAAFNSLCKCWEPPTYLFLICRTLLEDAQFVFFSGNRFIVHDCYASPPWRVPDLEHTQPGSAAPVSGYPNNCFTACEFPQERPDTWPRTGSRAMRDWFRTVDWLRDKINAPALILRLIVAEESDSNFPEVYIYPTTRDEGDLIDAAYTQLCWPLGQLAEDGLAGFHADFAYPWRLTPEYQERYDEEDDWDWVDDLKEKYKERAGRDVMGDRYDSLYANGRGAGHMVEDAYMALAELLKQLVEDGLTKFDSRFHYPWEWTDERRDEILEGNG